MPDSFTTERRITTCARRPIAALLVSLAAIGNISQAHSPVDPATVSEGHPTGHTQDHVGMSWPPQPRGIDNVVDRSDSEAQSRRARAQERQQAELDSVALQRAEVRQALGKRFTRLPLVEGQSAKDDIASSPVLVYFSHSRNATVEVEVNGGRAGSVRIIPASVYQPEITDEEIAEAEGLARTYFAGLGEERVAELEAFGILAYQPTGNGFFDSRVIYISFHPDNDSYPEYAAWVDLTHQRVLRSRKEQP